MSLFKQTRKFGEMTKTALKTHLVEEFPNWKPKKIVKLSDGWQVEFDCAPRPFRRGDVI